MSVTSGFFNSLNGDRKYSARQFSSLLDGLINDGIFVNIGMGFSVQADSGNNITVGTGRAWFNSAWIDNDAILPLTIRKSETLFNRIDAVVIEVNNSDSVRKGDIKVIAGIPSGNPQRPELSKSGNVFQYPLAYVTCRAGSTSIVQADITNMIGTSSCPYVTGILEVTNIDNIVAQWESEFRIWFESIKETSEGDPVVSLASRVIELEEKFSTLAKERTIYNKLQDQDGNEIEDNSGSVIQGRTVFAENGAIITLPAENGNENSETKTEPAYKVGHILTTTRTDLDNTWLLCNGDGYSRIAYPELSTTLPKRPDHGKWVSKELWSASTYGAFPYKCAYVNGYHVYFSLDTSESNTILGYASNPNGEWETVEVASKSVISKIAGIVYRDGRYIMAGVAPTGSFYKPVFMQSDSIAGPWTDMGIELTGFKPSGSSYYSISEDIVEGFSYVNGKYVVYGGTRDSNRKSRMVIAYADDIDGAWYYSYPYETTDRTGGRCNVTDIIYDGSRYVITGQKYDSSTDNYEAVVAWATSLASGWTLHSFASQSSGTNYGTAAYCVIFENGLYSVLYKDSSYAYVATTSDITSNVWNKIRVLGGKNTEDGAYQNVSMVFANGFYVVVGFTYPSSSDNRISMCYSKDGQQFSDYTDIVTSMAGSTALSNICATEQCYFLSYLSDTKSTYYTKLIMLDVTKMYTPKISLSDATYTYVKALE